MAASVHFSERRPAGLLDPIRSRDRVHLGGLRMSIHGWGRLPMGPSPDAPFATAHRSRLSSRGALRGAWWGLDVGPFSRRIVAAGHCWQCMACDAARPNEGWSSERDPSCLPGPQASCGNDSPSLRLRCHGPGLRLPAQTAQEPGASLRVRVAPYRHNGGTGGRARD